ncbi:MAG: isochorismate synthase [Patulibacter sp.]
MAGEALRSRPDRPPLTLDDAATTRLTKRLHAAAKRTGREPTLVSATSRIPHPGPLTNLLRGAHLTGEPWTLIEQPARDQRGLLALGAAATLTVDPRHPNRLRHIAHRWQQIASTTQADPPDGLPGSGPILTGGLAFAPGGGHTATWHGYGDGDFTIPTIAIATHRDNATLTVTLAVHPADDPDQHLTDAKLATALLVPQPPEPADPFLAPPAVRSVLAASHFTEAVARAIHRINDGEFDKIVLARELELRATQPWDTAELLHRLRDRYPGCFIFGVGRSGAAMIGASPELLLRREGQRAETVALAGSTRRSDDPSVDEHLADQLLNSPKDRHEHQLVVDRIRRTLTPHALWVAAADTPQVATIKNVHHLATPIRAQLDGRARLLDLVDALHPTPAVGGEPNAAALAAIPELEGLDRGWYAAPIGWTDRTGDGEFFVGLRSAIIRDTHARLFAGVGIVADSDPATELAETELKLGAMLSALRPA